MKIENWTQEEISEVSRIRNGIMNRCCNPNNYSYKWYGAIGINVCHGWMTSAMSFAVDMGKRPTKNHSVDRIDNDKGYWCGHCDECMRFSRPSNCKWSLPVPQANHRRNSILITAQGRTRTLAEWCRELGRSYSVMFARIKSGEDPWKALNRVVAPNGRVINGERKTTIDLAKEMNCSPGCISSRLRRMPSSEIFKDPVKRFNVPYEWNGRSLPLKQWSRELGIPYQTVHWRAKRGKPLNK